MGIKNIIGGAKAKVQAAATQKMMQAQLAKLPPEQRQVVMQVLQDNPDFFQNMAKEIQAEVEKGKSQMTAAMIVMKKYQGKMQQLMQDAAMKVHKTKSDRNLK